MIRKKNFMSLQALFILDAIDKCGGKRKVSEIIRVKKYNPQSQEYEIEQVV